MGKKKYLVTFFLLSYSVIYVEIYFALHINFFLYLCKLKQNHLLECSILNVN